MEVAQNWILLYRGFLIRGPSASPTLCRLQIGDTAGCKPALHQHGWPAALSDYEISALDTPHYPGVKCADENFDFFALGGIIKVQG